MPVRQMWKLLVGVTLLFSFSGFYADLMDGGTWPYAIALAIALYSGLTAAVFVITLARLPLYCALILGIATFFGKWTVYLAHWIEHTFHPASVPAETGVHFAATAIMCAVSSSYIFLGMYMREMGTEALRLRTELTLAHSIQKTLVPPVTRTTACFEIYGVSHPSDKVGGDLVDVVELPGGDTVAYLADIAGHGLQAGILMGMLKTAARMALADPNAAEGGAALSELMLRLNFVLPQVKEAHMYATFTSLRLDCDGECFFGMAASPPLLHWSAAGKSVAAVEEQQFPLGLLPVSDFPAHRLAMEAGDLVVIATDGILEVNSKERSAKSAEFGVGALEMLVSDGAGLPLHELAASILQSVRSYGKQLDDQTLLLVRRRTSRANDVTAQNPDRHDGGAERER